VAVLLALTAALLFALAGAAQQRAASWVLRPSGASAGNLVQRGLHQAARLAGTPLWLAGWSADAAGFVVQASALRDGSLSVVQPLLVTTILFSLPLAAIGGRHRPRPADWAAAAAVCAGLVTICAGEHPRTAGPPHGGRVVVATLAVAAVAAGLAAAARRGRARAVLLSMAAGTLFSIGAAMTKLVCTGIGEHGVWAMLGYWPGYVLAAASLAGVVLQQRGFATGSLPVTMTALTVTEPLISYLFGVVALGEPGPRGAAGLACAVVGSLVLGAAIALLARSPLLRHATAAPEASALRAGVVGPAEFGEELVAAVRPLRVLLHDALEERRDVVPSGVLRVPNVLPVVVTGLQ
jgi:drug/metabolite transporter (DMT)-like permease